MPKKTNYIPARWDDYSPVGSVIKGTNFICFKVPLSAAFRPKEKFTPHDLLSNLSTKGLRLGLIIDLTFTDRYYNGHTEFTNQGVQYLKLPIPGSKEESIPPEDCVQGFIRAIDDYLNSATDPDALIGIHCTHGLNRTGYLVCCYMIERLGLSPADAIARFNIARGHNMEKYTGALMSRSTGAEGTLGNLTDGEEDDEEDSSDSTVGQNLSIAIAAGGSSPGDAASSVSIAAARRKRRNNLKKRFITMKRGKIWEFKEVLEEDAERKDAKKRKINKPNE